MLIVESITKNKKYPNANCGKYHKKWVAVPVRSVRTISEIKPSTGNRIINLHSLQVHLQEVTNHVATCQACRSKTLQDKHVILFGKANHAGLTSVLCSRCAGCQQEFKFSTSAKVKGMSGGKQRETNLAAIWARWPQEEDTSHSWGDCDPRSSNYDQTIIHDNWKKDRWMVERFAWSIHDK